MSKSFSDTNSISRRGFLKAGATLPLHAHLLGGRPASSQVLRPASFNVISGVDPSTDPRLLEALIQPLVAQKWPLVVGVCPHNESGKALQSSSSVCALLRGSMARFPTLIELALELPILDRSSQYTTLRQVSDAQAILTRAMNPHMNVHGPTLLRATTLLTQAEVGTKESLSELRAADVRTVIHLPSELSAEETSNRGYWLTDLGVAKCYGRLAFSSARTVSESVPEMMRATEESGPVIYTIRLSDPIVKDLGSTARYGEELARQLSEVLNSSGFRLSLPATLHRQSWSGPTRYVVVRVDDFRLFPADHEKFVSFVKALRSRGIPLTIAVIPGGQSKLESDEQSKRILRDLSQDAAIDIAPHGLEHTPSELLGRNADEALAIVSAGIESVFAATGTVPISYIPPNNAHDDITLQAYQKCGGRLFSSGHGSFQFISGLDRFGILHASHTVAPESTWTDETPYFDPSEIIRQIGQSGDAVFMIHPQTIRDESHWRTVFDVLERLNAEPKTQLCNLRQFYGSVMPDIPSLRRMQSDRFMVHVVDTKAALPPDRDHLLEDAKLAWRYFDYWGARFDGMAPATAWRDGDSFDCYPFATMWDVASTLMACMAAYQLNFLGQQQFEGSIAGILRFIDRARYRAKSLNLPAAEWSLSGKSGARDGFDVIDTGRLLIALKILDEMTQGKFSVGRLVESWTLGAALIDGRLHDLGRRRPRSKHENSYAVYAAQGFGLWGYKTAPVFDQLHPLHNMDETIPFVAEVRRRGRIATEPLTTEQIEVGQTEHMAVVADLLFAAQIERYNSSKQLTCVSEGPSDQSPWFTYQGYQLQEAGGEFVVDLPPGSKRMSEARKSSLRSVSTKGCFLWLATRPGLYSTRLHEFARSNGRIEGLGFASGVLESTQKATTHSDVNTNGLILEAILYILSGSKPLLDLAFGATMSGGATFPPLRDGGRL